MQTAQTGIQEVLRDSTDTAGRPGCISARFYGLKFEDIENSYQVRQLIRRGLMATDAINDYSVDDVMTMIQTMKAQCWGWHEDDQLRGIVVTRIMVYPKRKVLQCFLAAGSRVDEWLEEGLAVLAAFGRANGCTGLKGSGRPGWLKKLKVKGYRAWSKTI